MLYGDPPLNGYRLLIPERRTDTYLDSRNADTLDFRHDWSDGGGEGDGRGDDRPYDVPDPPQPGIMLLLSLTLAVIIVCSIALGMALEALLLLA